MGAPMMPNPIKPTFIMPISLLIVKCSDAVLGAPAEAIVCAAPGFVFATDPAVVAECVEMLEQEAVIDLARARLVAAGIIGQLHMADQRQVGLDGGCQLAFHALHVIDVVLDQ